MGVVFRAFAAMKEGQPVLQDGCLRLFATAEAAAAFGEAVRVMLDDIADRREPRMFMWPAEAYLTAAQDVRKGVATHSHGANNLSLPIEFLLGHALELALKAMLRVGGTPTSEEARALGSGRRPKGPTIEEYGHDLVRMLMDCIRRGLGGAAELTPGDIDAVSRFSEYFEAHVSRYPPMGGRRLPDETTLIELVERIVKVARADVERDAKARKG